MFCKFVGNDGGNLIHDTVYYLSDANISNNGNRGMLRVILPGLGVKNYVDFNEFVTDWEII